MVRVRPYARTRPPTVGAPAPGLARRPARARDRLTTHHISPDPESPAEALYSSKERRVGHRWGVEGERGHEPEPEPEFGAEAESEFEFEPEFEAEPEDGRRMSFGTVLSSCSAPHRAGVLGGVKGEPAGGCPRHARVHKQAIGEVPTEPGAVDSTPGQGAGPPL